MKKLGFPSMKTLDQFKTLPRSPSGAAKSFWFSSRSPSDSNSAGSFSNLKLAAEKLVKEQASVKTDLEMANSKLKKTMENVRVLEEKLQNSFNENAKLKVKQKEDEKLWKGLESKFSSTKSLCDQLTETLQHLAVQVQDAEKDKEIFEGKLSENSKAIDCLNKQMGALSLKLGSAEESIRNREKELGELKIEKEEREKLYQNEQCRIAGILEEKDAMIRKFEATLEANRLAAENLNNRLGEVDLQLTLKENEIKRLLINQENLEKDKSDLQLSNEDVVKQLATSLQEIRNLEGFVHVLAARLGVLDKQNMSFLDKFEELNNLNDCCFKLVHQEKDIVSRHAQIKYRQLHDKFLCITSEKDALQLENQELNTKITELLKAQESVLAHLSEECRLAAEKIQRLESEAEGLLLKKTESEKLVAELEGKISTLSETSRLSENKVQYLLLKISALEMENKDYMEKTQTEILLKTEEIDNLRKESEKHHVHEGSLEKQVCELLKVLEEKEQLILRYKEREKELEVQVKENQTLLTLAESRLIEAKKQHDQMLEGKQLELSRHLKEISQRNDQAINDIRRKYELEKQEIVHAEGEKAEKAIQEMERKCEQRMEECKEESKQHLIRIQEEHAAQVIHIQQEHDKREQIFKFDNGEELKHFQLKADNELRERIKSLRNEHEVQLKALRCQFEDMCQKLQEELDLQKSREERQRALLQLQWKVMGDNPQEDKEVNSKKEYSVSSIKMRDSSVGKRSQHALARPGNDEEESPLMGVTQTPMSKLLKKVESVNPGHGMNIPKHHKKVTHHEYEVETNNGRTITKRRKTKSTVMFEDPRKQKRMNTPKLGTPRSFVKGGKGDHPKPSNIGDLFSEGSLNPYADDPYAFD